MFSVFKNLNQFAGKSNFLDGTAIFCARILPYFLAGFLFLFAFLQKDFRLFFYPLVSALLGRLLNEVVHLFYRKQRPASLEQTKVLIPVPKNLSCPSGHASFFFGMSFFLFYYNAILAVVFLILSFIIGIARVFCGVHWFRDILSGALVGLLSALLVFSFFAS